MIKSKLDKWDICIIKAFETINQENYSKIGKLIKRSKAFVRLRINNLLQNQIISGPKPIVNFLKLGYCCVHIYFNFNKNISEEVLNFLKKNDNTEYFNVYIGKYQLGIFLKYKSEEELVRFVNELKEIESFRLHDIFIIKNYINYPHNFIYNSIIKNNYLLEKSINGFKAKNEFLDYLSGKIKSTQKKYRLKNKYRDYISCRFSLNANKLGFLTKSILIRSKNSLNSKIFLESQKSLIFLSETVGRYDIIADLVFKSNKEFFNFLYGLNNGNFVDSYLILDGFEKV
ncbi:MAG: hypothetical protein U9Q69_05670 [Nanoarchaeota archaeon]|nr:hypothetical protein [Nanoarchaeota archaeon]